VRTAPRGKADVEPMFAIAPPHFLQVPCLEP
jgi:hypothetical protein